MPRRVLNSFVIVVVLLGCCLNCKAQETVSKARMTRVLAWEKRINEERMPPQKVMDAVGIKSGMVIGEIGAGRGRYTVHLAGRVGDSGKVLANDIDSNALSFLRSRCRQNNIKNVETILGKMGNPLFPKNSLDMSIMVWVYHMIDRAAPLMKSLKDSLKPGALLVILDPLDEEINQEMKEMGRKLDPPTLKGRILKDAEETGFEVVKILTFLPEDVIYILKVKE